MRTYDFTKNYEKLLTPDIVALLTQIHEYKGEQALFIEAKADTLTKLVEITKIRSAEASNLRLKAFVPRTSGEGSWYRTTTPVPGTKRRPPGIRMCWPPSMRALAISRPKPP